MTRKFVQPAGHGGALRQRGGDEQHGEFVDHRGGDGGIDLHPGQRRMPHPQVGHRLAADFAAVQLLDAAAHRRSTSNSAARVGLRPTLAISRSLPGTSKRRDGEEGGGRGIAGNHDGLRAQVRLAVNADHARAILLAHFQLGAKPAQHPFGMVAGGDGFDHAW